MIAITQLEKEAAEVGVSLSPRQLEQFGLYAKLLSEWNEKMNLTAITRPEEIVTKHFVDSLTVLRAVCLPEGARVVDVGTGAGFPGVAMKIARPDIRITLLDSLKKRLVFLEEVSQRLGQENEIVHMRAEEAGQRKEFREQYDCATARAVAHLRELSEFCLPLVKVGGAFAAQKGADTGMELREAKKAIHLLGGKAEEPKQFQLGDGSGRSIVVIKKISQSPLKYPRPHAKIAKFPL